MIGNMLDNKALANLVSCIIGFGFAIMFRKICKDGKCVVIRGPPMDKTKATIYKTEGRCVKYTPYPVKC